jgi:hypothetical protein
MAKNLREKIPKSDTLYIQDVNTDATTKFVQEFPDYPIVVAKSAREVAENAVCVLFPLLPPNLMMNVYFPFSNFMN